jgi:nucleotide-binding universal stress UspA family protein
MLLGLRIAVGHCSEEILEAAHRLPADLVVMGWKGVLKSGRAWTVRAVCSGAPCPVLLVAAPSPPVLPLAAIGGRLTY